MRFQERAALFGVVKSTKQQCGWPVHIAMLAEGKRFGLFGGHSRRFQETVVITTRE